MQAPEATIIDQMMNETVHNLKEGGLFTSSQSITSSALHLMASWLPSLSLSLSLSPSVGWFNGKNWSNPWAWAQGSFKDVAEPNNGGRKADWLEISWTNFGRNVNQKKKWMVLKFDA